MIIKTSKQITHDYQSNSNEYDNWIGIDEINLYLSQRLTDLGLMLANYEDEMCNLPIDCDRKTKEKYLEIVDNCRGRINELKRLQKIIGEKE